MTILAPRPIADLVEEVAARLTSEQLHAVAARVAAAEARPPEDPARPDLAAAVALDIDGAVARLVALWGRDGVGIDNDILAAWLLPQLVRAGAPEPVAVAALGRHLGWRPRTQAERMAAVAKDRLAAGLSPDEVRRALARLYGDQGTVAA